MPVEIQTQPSVAALPNHQVEASFRYQAARTNIPIVELDIEGQGTFTFIVDTGANTSAIYIDSPAVRALTRLDGEELLVRSLTGVASRPAAKLSGLKLGNRTYNDVLIALLDARSTPPHVDGILGTDILRNYGLIFDPELNQLDLVTATDFDREAYSSWHIVPIAPLSQAERAQRLWFARTTIGSENVPVLIDTGADFSVMNWTAARRSVHLGAIYQSLRQDWEVAGAIGEFRPTISIIVDNFIMGEHRWGAPRFLVFDFSSLTDILGEGEPLIIAGANLFAYRRFAIDFHNNQLFIDPNGPHLEQEEGAPERAPSKN